MRRNPLLRCTLVAVFAGLAAGGSALATCSGSCEGMRADIGAAETAAFAEADTNGDGKLTPDEFARFHDLLRQKLEALRFTRLDTNGDGVLTKEELDAGHAEGHRGSGRFGRGF